MNRNQFAARLNNHPKPIIVDLWAPWCAPCRAMEPAFKEASQNYTGQVDVLKVNADESPDVLKSLRVMGIPTVIVFSGGKEIMRRTGVQSATALNVLFEAALTGRKPAIVPLAPLDRLLRAIGGLALLAIGWGFGHAILWLVPGAVLLFSAVYDRCPVYRAIVPRLADWFHKRA